MVVGVVIAVRGRARSAGVASVAGAIATVGWRRLRVLYIAACRFLSVILTHGGRRFVRPV